MLFRPFLLSRPPAVDYIDSTRGRLGFDGFDEGIAACPGPGSWLNRLERFNCQF